MSVTTLIEMFFPHFDEEAYIQKRMEETGMSEEAVRRELAEPSERGTDMHKQIENYLKGLPYDGSSVEFQHFLKFHQEQIVRRGLVFDSAEYAIELKESNIAGTVDALFRKSNGEYVMVDWKRSKHLIIDGYPKKYGFVITNPPYGERLEEKRMLPALYREIGEAFRRLDSWSEYVITSYDQAEKYIGRKADKNRKIYNGMIKTYLYQFQGPKPPQKAVREVTT